MIKEKNNFVNIREILARVTSHSMLKNVDLEQAIRYTVDFISIMGCPTFYLDKEVDVTIEDYRGFFFCFCSLAGYRQKRWVMSSSWLCGALMR